MALLCPDNLGSLSSVCGLQDWMVASGNHGPGDVDVCFNLQQTLFHEPYSNQGITQSLGFGYNSNEGSEAAQMQEFDCLLQFQNERLRWALQKQRKQQVATLMNNACWVMSQKEQHLAQETKRAMALRDYLARAEMERDSWQRLAKEKEAIVADLNERLGLLTNTPDDAQSSNSEPGRGRNRDMKMACKGCNRVSSSLVFLPCRHLCSCKSCEPFLASCPVCQSVKETTMEVFFA